MARRQAAATVGNFSPHGPCAKVQRVKCQHQHCGAVTLEVLRDQRRVGRRKDVLVLVLQELPDHPGIAYIVGGDQYRRCGEGEFVHVGLLRHRGGQ